MTSFTVTDVRVWTGNDIFENGSVVVKDGKIARVLPGSSSQYQSSIIEPVYSRPGHTLLPGLIDCHVHVDGGNEVALPQALRFGVTTVCDLHNTWELIEKLHRQREGGDCADLKTAGNSATVKDGWPAAIVLMHNDTPETRAEIATWADIQTVEDGKLFVAEQFRRGANYIKLMHESGKVLNRQLNRPSVELQKAIIDEAHKHGLLTLAHATCLDDTVEILEAGVDGMAHCFVDQPPIPRVIEAYKTNNAHCNPTLAALGSGTTEGHALQERLAHDPRVEKLLGQVEKERMCLCMRFVKAEGASIEYAYETVRQLKAAGVPVLVGSDAAGPAVGTAWGLSAHHEMSLLVNSCGFSPEEAIRAATVLVAERFRFADRGSLEEGYRADLLLVEGNPFDDIDNLLNLRGVWTEGQLCSAYNGQFA